MFILWVIYSCGFVDVCVDMWAVVCVLLDGLLLRVCSLLVCALWL